MTAATLDVDGFKDWVDELVSCAVCKDRDGRVRAQKRVLETYIALLAERDALREHVVAAEDQYYDLILQVENKHPGETRHETAKRYIQQVEHSGDRADAVQATSGEGA